MKTYVQHIITLLISAVFLALAHISVAQDVQSNPKLDQYLLKQKYIDVIEFYEKKGEEYKDELKAYYLGVASYHIPYLKLEAKAYLEEYVNTAPEVLIAQMEHIDAYFLLGNLYHLTYEISAAEKMYEQFIEAVEQSRYIPGFAKDELLADVNRRLQWCDNSRSLINNPRNVIIENLGDTINSIYPEYAPVVSNDESKLIFTSRRPDSKGGRIIRGEGYFEDIYAADLLYGSLFEQDVMWASEGEVDLSIVTDFSYANLKNLGDYVNGVSHEGSIQLSPDETELYFYRDSDIWQVNISEDSIQGVAKRLDVKFNSKAHEPSIFINSDKTKIYVVSDKPGGYGGMDLYVSLINEDGTWGKLVNLGPKVNTAFDEDAPYLDPDNETLYFSSTGHSSMGGYDIFRCKVEGTSASSPVNLGYPVNTTGDDIYFTMTSKYNRGYYSSNHLGGKGDMDVYRISFADERDPISELKGYVKEGTELVPIASNIEMKSADGKELLTETSSATDGSYYFVLGTGKTYNMTLTTDGYAPYQRDFKIPERKDYFRLMQEIHHIHLKNSKGEIIGQQIILHTQDGSSAELLTTDPNDSTLIRTSSEFIETKFYMTQDSLLKLMATDLGLEINYGENGVVEFLDKNSSEKSALSSYSEGQISDVESEIEFIREVGVESYFTEIENFKEDELVYSVQLGWFSKELSSTKLFEKFGTVNSYQELDGGYSYYSDTFSSYADAQAHRDSIINKGQEGAFITAYYQGEKITTRKALNLQRRHELLQLKE